MKQNVMENSSEKRKALDKIKLQGDLSRYLNRTRAMRSFELDNLVTHLEALLYKVASADEADIQRGLGVIKREATSIMERFPPMSSLSKLASEIKNNL
jgi:hypothetical protein